MKSIIATIFFLTTICRLGFGQNRKLTDEEINKSSAIKMVFADTIRNCEVIDEWVKSDISHHTVFLFLQGGIAPKVYTTDQDFENKFDIYFFDFGCTAPDYKCIIRYNTRIFEYLTSKYGKQWLKKIRKDVIGLARWKKGQISNTEH